MTEGHIWGTNNDPFHDEKIYSAKEQAERDEMYSENKKILSRLRYHLDQADSYARIGRDHLQGIETDIDPVDLEDAFCALAAAEKENEELVG